MEAEYDDLIVHPAPIGAVGNQDFSVRVRRPQGEWQPLFCYNVKVDMHEVRNASMVSFDCAGVVELEVIKHKGNVREATVRPLSTGLNCTYIGNRMLLILDGPRQLSLEVNGDRFHNLHIFANPLEQDIPHSSGPEVVLLKAGSHATGEILEELDNLQSAEYSKIIYFEPGIHYLDTSRLNVPANTVVYVAGGAVIYGGLICNHVHDVKICGRGMLYLSDFEKATYYRGVEISHSQTISVEGITMIDPPHYTILIGQSEDIHIQNIKTFSTRGWSDGIDMMSCSNVSIDHVFLRTSDDCIAIYGSRGEFHGDSRNIYVSNSILWADVAHPMNIGTHGDYAADGDMIENITFSNIDILEHHEPQPDYWGCMAINVGDKNTVRNVTYEGIRIESFELGELFNLRVLQNPKYNPAPGNRIENIRFKDISFSGSCENPSHLEGYDETRTIDGVKFENVVINGRNLELTSNDLIIGSHVHHVSVCSQRD
ncbi:MAG: hypothetical protein K6T85_14775 [Gorillibacterium sp.]|nr:hypothetical protein [Gorillibacterium sp.]